MKTEAVAITVFVSLKNEGTPVWRPVRAEQLDERRFRLTGPMPEGEDWHFHPGSVVRCVIRTFQDGTQALVVQELGDA